METSRKIVIVISILFLVAIIGIIVMVNIAMRSHARKTALWEAQMVLNKNDAIRHYFMHTVTPAVNKVLSPSLPKDYFNPVWMSSCYALTRIESRVRHPERKRYLYKNATINSRNIENEAEMAEAAFLGEASASTNISDRHELILRDNKPFLVAMRRGPVVSSECLQCHSDPMEAPREVVEAYGAERGFGRNPGDVAAIFSAWIPLTLPYSIANHLSFLFSCVVVVIFGCILSLYFYLNKKLIVSPLSSIHALALRIAGDPAALGETIAASPETELGRLAGAINAMSLNLRDTLGQLRSRTEELEKTNVSLSQEIEERKQAVKALGESVDEKDVLLREIHHRTKNNMQIIISLIRLQETESGNAAMREMLTDIRNRIQSMSAIHEKLYHSKNLGAILFSDYLRSFATDLVRSLAEKQPTIDLRFDLEPFTLGIDKAIPCGLILNELVTNAVKHAFPDDAKGAITISAEKKPGGVVEIRIRDNGTGLPPGFDLHGPTSFGLQLAVNLAEKQLGGTLEAQNGTGTEFIIRFTER